MGRDKPKKYNKMGYFQQQAYYREQAKNYNIDTNQFENAAHGGGRYEDFDDDALREAVTNAQRNDFDYRTSAQHMDGIKGDGSSADFVNYQRGAHKLHRKAGNGGEYSSNEDITTVTNNLVNDYRSGLQDQIAAAGKSSAAPDFQQVDRGDNNAAIKLSTAAASAQAGEDAYKDFRRGGGYEALMSGDLRASAALKQQAADNTQEYLKPNAQSQLGKGLDEQGNFRMAGQVFS